MWDIRLRILEILEMSQSSTVSTHWLDGWYLSQGYEKALRSSAVNVNGPTQMLLRVKGSVDLDFLNGA